MSHRHDASPAQTVIIVGPAETITGGMSSVVGQMTRLDFAPGYRQCFVPITLSPGLGESRIARIVRHVRQVARLAAAIRKARASITHIHTCSGFSFWRSLLDVHIAHLAGCRTVLHIHGAKFAQFYDGAGIVGKRLIRTSLTRPNVVVALSRSWHDTLRRIAPRAIVRTIENAVHVPDEPPTGRHAGPRRFLLLARMDIWKGVDDLLEACRILRGRGQDFELTLAGPEGSAGNADTIGARIKQLGLDASVRCVGEVRGGRKNHWLRWADVYVQPSHNEGMPIAVLEAMAHALPVIATRVGAMPEIIEPGRHGLLTPPHDPQSLAEAMGRLAAAEGETCRRMGSAARTLVRTRFSLTRLRSDLVELYDSLDRQRQATPGAEPSMHPRTAAS